MERQGRQRKPSAFDTEGLAAPGDTARCSSLALAHTDKSDQAGTEQENAAGLGHAYMDNQILVVVIAAWQIGKACIGHVACIGEGTACQIRIHAQEVSGQTLFIRGGIICSVVCGSPWGGQV